MSQTQKERVIEAYEIHKRFHNYMGFLVCDGEEDMLVLRKLVKKIKQEAVNDYKSNHPKGPCMICGSGKRTTIHHLRTMDTRIKGRETGTVVLCRVCHDWVEGLKSEMKAGWHKGYNQAVEDSQTQPEVNNGK